jgi:hypothetical protein
MGMIELFQEQVENNPVVTEEKLKTLTKKTYHSGREIKPGDKILYTFINDPEEKVLTLVQICMDDFDLYVESELSERGGFPVVMTKK